MYVEVLALGHIDNFEGDLMIHAHKTKITMIHEFKSCLLKFLKSATSCMNAWPRNALQQTFNRFTLNRTTTKDDHEKLSTAE